MTSYRLVAQGKMNYAEAIKTVVGRPTSVVTKSARKPDSAQTNQVSNGACGRADVIDAPVVKSWPMFRRTAIPTKSSTTSTGCQTDPEPVEAVTQTTMDCASQTEDMPA
jgi:hypothetical protein